MRISIYISRQHNTNEKEGIPDGRINTSKSSDTA